MKKKVVALFSSVVCLAFMLLAILLFFTTEGSDAGKMKVLCIGLVLFMLQAFYRIYRYSKTETVKSEVDETQLCLQQTKTFGGFLCVFFNPTRLQFRTSFSLFILLVLWLFASAFWFWVFFIVLVVAKIALFFSYYRYMKVYQQLKSWEKRPAILVETDDEDNESDETDDEI